MSRRKTTINTSSREIYEKFNMLNFSNEVMLKNTKPDQLERIMKNVNNGKNNILQSEQIGNYFIVKKLNPINYNVYYKPKKSFKEPKSGKQIYI